MRKGLISSSFYRNEIDGLKGIAIISVIINHFNTVILPSGYLGVDIFFVISGYLITGSLLRRKKSLKDFIFNFYESRIKRILPLLCTYIFITSLLICLVNVNPIDHLRTAFFSLTGFSNIFIYKISNGYFTSSSSLNPFTNTWSLSVEEQFYFIYPLLAWFTCFKWNKEISVKYLIFTLLFLGSISLILFLTYYSINQNAAYFLMPYRFWEIAVGCLTSLTVANRFKFLKYLKKLDSNFLFILILFIFFLPISFGGFSNLAIVIITAIIIISINKNDLIYKFLNYKIISKIGLMSFPLYLWHWTIISISTWTIGVKWWTLPFQLSLIFLLSYLSYKYIEIPFRTIQTKKLISYFAAFFVILCTQLILLILGTIGKRYLFLGSFSGLFKQDIASNTIFPNQCNLIRNNFEEVSKNPNCSSLINSKGKKRIILLGDSHANMFFRSFKILAKNNFKIINFTGNGCSIPLIINNRLNNTNRCATEMKKVQEWIPENINSGDIIFIGNHRVNHKFIYLFGQKSTSETDPDIENYFNELNKFSEVVLKKGASVHFLVDGPKFFGVSDPYCSIEWFRPYSFIEEDCFLDKAKFEQKRNLFLNFLFKKNKNFNIFYEYLDSICDEKTCSAKGYLDSSHISDYLGLLILKNSYFGDTFKN